MKRLRSSRRLPIVAGIIAALAFLAFVVVGLQRASVAQTEAVISLDAPVSFPADI